jgi:type IV secretory pathway TrbD component
MTTGRELHRVYKALHRPLMVGGVDRRLFFLALMMAAAMFNLFYSFLAGLLTFTIGYGVARWSTTRDPHMLQILLSSSRFRARYDAAKHARVPMEGAGW